MERCMSNKALVNDITLAYDDHGAGQPVLFLHAFPLNKSMWQETSAIADLQMPRLISDYTRQHSPAVERRIQQMIASATPQGIAAASRGMALRADSTDLLGNITYPTLVLVGEHDVLIPPQVV